jgi:hypothetical protein
MGKGYIVRKGGGASKQTQQPTLNFVNSTLTSITFTITNNDDLTAVIFWEVGNTNPTENSVQVGVGETTSNLTIDNLTEGDLVNIYAVANSSGKLNSAVSLLSVGTRLAEPTITEINKTGNSITFTILNNSNVNALISYGLTSALETTTTLQLQAGQTSSNQTISNLSPGESVSIFAQAKQTNYSDSTITITSITTALSYTNAAGGNSTLEYNLDGKRYRSHTFTSSGTLTVFAVGDAIDNRDKLEYLVIGGGGGGGGINTNARGFGGGGGGYRSSVIGETSRDGNQNETPLTATIKNYIVTIGQGGIRQTSGSSTTFDTIVATGGTGGTTSAKGNWSGAGGVSKIRTGLNETRGSTGGDGATGGSGGNGGGGAANSGNGGGGVSTRSVTDSSDCANFVLPNLAHSHYTECLKNPSAYSQYYNWNNKNGGTGGSGVVIVRYQIEPQT